MFLFSSFNIFTECIVFTLPSTIVKNTFLSLSLFFLSFSLPPSNQNLNSRIQTLAFQPACRYKTMLRTVTIWFLFVMFWNTMAQTASVRTLIGMWQELGGWEPSNRASYVLKLLCHGTCLPRPKLENNHKNQKTLCGEAATTTATNSDNKIGFKTRVLFLLIAHNFHTCSRKRPCRYDMSKMNLYAHFWKYVFRI